MRFFDADYNEPQDNNENTPQEMEQNEIPEIDLEQILGEGSGDDKIVISRKMLSKLQFSVEQSIAEINEALDAKEAAEEAKAKAEEEAKKAKDDYMLVVAQSQTFRRRQLEETKRLESLARENIFTEMLPIIDNFERALEAAETSNDFDALLEGITLIFRQFKDFMAKNNVEYIDCMGKEFDPMEHEAMMCIADDEHEPNTVIVEHEKGYKLGDRVLRPSKVAVSKSPDE